MKRLFLILPLLLILASCSVDKYVGEQKKVLRNNHYLIEMSDGQAPPKEVREVLSGLKSYTAQTPNSKVLDMRLSMRLYCLSNPKKSNALHNYLRRQGSAPVVYSTADAYSTASQLQSLLESKGCFRSEVTFDTAHLRHHDMEVTYHIRPSRRYRIEKVTYRAETEEVNELLPRWREESLLRQGDFYDQQTVAAERDRLTTLLRNEGYYLATKDNILFYIDTANEDGTLNLAVSIRNPRQRNAQGQLESIPLQRHHIDRIYFYPSASTIAHDTLDYPYGQRRTTHFTFVNPDEFTLSPQVICRNMFLFHGQPYRDRWVDATYNSLLNLRNFKYINIEFTPSPSSSPDSALIDAHIKLIPNKKQRLSFSFEVNNSSSMQDVLSEHGNFGVEATLSYQNKNLFRRHSGLLTIDLSGLVELPKSFDATIAALEVGADATLDLPTFLLPFQPKGMVQRRKPHTLFGLGANYQNRPNFERVLANVSFGYTWTDRSSKHQYLPFELTYAQFFHIDPAFLSNLNQLTNSGRLLYQYSDHLILDTRYDYLYTDQVFGSRQDFTYLHLTAESAGNLLYGVSCLTPFPTDSLGVRELFGVPFSQYIRLQGEWKHYFYHGKKSSLVTRALLGVGLPYLNSDQMQMPYEKSFFGGGPTTLRAWHLRHLGPGTALRDENHLLERTGDISLVLNLEERFPLLSALEGALFLDMGNVWLIYPNEEMPGGQISLRDLPRSIAVGTGFGLRLNVSILTLRLDMGLPLLDPGYPQGQRFRLPHWGDYAWHVRDFSLGPLMLNFGIDYPF